MPDGYRFALENMQSIVPNGAFVELTPFPPGAPYRFPAGDQRYTANVMAAIEAVMASPTNYTVLAPAPVIDTVTLSTPDITVATVIITGFGFYPDTVGRLYFEDDGGGQDSNGYYSVCTNVDGQNMTAVYGGPGDAGLGPGAVLIYYQDSHNAKSNMIAGTNPSGTLVTIP